MKKYRIGGSKGIITFLTIFSFVSAGILAFPLTMLIREMTYGYGGAFLLPIFFGFLPMIGLIIFLNIFFRKQYKRKVIALSGNKSTGKILKKYMTYSKSGPQCNIEVQYKTESGEDAIFVTQLAPKHTYYFQVGAALPIYVKGEYAYFKEDEIYETAKKEEQVKEFSEPSKKVNNGSFSCPYCGQSFVTKVDRCPKCRSKII